MMCVGLPIVLLALFREAFRRSHPLLAALAAATCAAYILHRLISVGVQSAIADLQLPALVEFGLVTVGAVGFASGIGHVSRRVPGRRVVLGTRAESPKAPGTPSEVSS